MSTTSTQYSILETVSPSPNAGVDTAVSIRLVLNNERNDELNGIESILGMCWGELRKWIHQSMNHIRLQPDLIKLLRHKDILLTPSPALMAQIREFIDYNIDHPKNPQHFLKRFPPGTYEYTIIPTIYAGSLFARRDASTESIEHPAPYYESLTFRSDAHPCFVLSFSTLDLISRCPPTILREIFPIRRFANYAASGLNLPFYCRPYLGWMPRAIPYVDLVRLCLIPSQKYLPSSSSEQAVPLRKRSKVLSSRMPVDDLIAVERWRYRVVQSHVTSVAGDTVLDAYEREASRQLADAILSVPLCLRTLGIEEEAQLYQ